MKRMKLMVEKLIFLAAMSLSLTSLADVVSPAWDERVMVPVFNMPEWLFCGAIITGFVVLSVLIFIVMWHNGRPSMEFVLLETIIAAALICLLVLCKSYGFLYEERVIHHPEERPHHRYQPSEAHGGNKFVVQPDIL